MKKIWRDIVIGFIIISLFAVGHEEAFAKKISTVEITSPNGGSFLFDSILEVTWDAENIKKPYDFRVSLRKGPEILLQQILPHDARETSFFLDSSNSLIESGGMNYTVGIDVVKKSKIITGDSSGNFEIRGPIEPIYERLSIPSNALTNGEMTMYRFKAAAPSTSGVSISSFQFSISSTTSATTSSYKLFVYTDSGFSNSALPENPIITRPGGTNFVMVPAAPVIIPAGTSRYFEFRGTVSNASPGDSISVRYNEILAPQILSKDRILPQTIYERLPIPTNTLVNGMQELYRFRVTAPPASDTSISSFHFFVSSTMSATISYEFFAYSDSAFSNNAFSENPIFTHTTTGGNFVMTSLSPIVIPAGTTLYFSLHGGVGSVGVGDFISVQYDGLEPQVLSSSPIEPTYERLAISSDTLVNGPMMLYRFKAVNPLTHSGITIVNFPFSVSSTTSATTTNFELFAYMDSGFSVPAYHENPITVLNEAAVNFTLTPSFPIVVSAGTTRYFELRGTVLNVSVGDSISVQFDGLLPQILSK